nr:hypothetical protein [Tanacetum cinerariifolium]
MNIEPIDMRMVPSIIDHAIEKPRVLIPFQRPSNFSFLLNFKMFLCSRSASDLTKVYCSRQHMVTPYYTPNYLPIGTPFPRAAKPYNAPPPTSQAPPTTSQRGVRYYQLPPSAQWPPNHHDPLPDYDQRPPPDHYQSLPLAQWARQMAIMPYQPPPPQAPEMMDDRPHQPTP